MALKRKVAKIDFFAPSDYMEDTFREAVEAVGAIYIGNRSVRRGGKSRRIVDFVCGCEADKPEEERTHLTVTWSNKASFRCNACKRSYRQEVFADKNKVDEIKEFLLAAGILDCTVRHILGTRQVHSQYIVEYECPNCGERASKEWRNIRNDKTQNAHFCSDCCKNPVRYSDDELRKLVEDGGFEYIGNERRVEDGKTRLYLQYKCNCGRDVDKVIDSFHVGKSVCKKCALVKRDQTCMEKYGVRNANQCSSVRLKGKFSEFVGPGGKLFKYQGFELCAINQLLREGYDEYDIATDYEMLKDADEYPEFWYQDDEGKSRRYFPDICLPMEHKFIEVKSVYHGFDENLDLKIEAVNNEGYDIEVWRFNSKNQLTSKISHVCEQ